MVKLRHEAKKVAFLKDSILKRSKTLYFLFLLDSPYPFVFSSLKSNSGKFLSLTCAITRNPSLALLNFFFDTRYMGDSLAYLINGLPSATKGRLSPKKSKSLQLLLNKYANTPTTICPKVQNMFIITLPYALVFTP